MNILAVNGSPRGKAGNTERILEPFLAGAREAGARTETVYLKDKRIEHCKGCFTCWTKTPGVCIHRDDMPELLERIRRADVLVLASPLYIFTVSGLMKDFMDRMIPLADPHMVQGGHGYVHPPRYPTEGEDGRRGVILISNCGYPERHHFVGLLETFRLLAAGLHTSLAATILCAGGELLSIEQLKDDVEWYRKAAREAGGEFVRRGGISPDTQAALDGPLAEPDVYAGMANAYWDGLIARPSDEPIPREESNLLPLGPVVPEKGRPPADFRELVAGQAASFNPRAAGDLRADIQFRTTQAGDFVLRIASGRCQAYAGKVAVPSITILTPPEVWLQIARGELSGQTAFMKGLYRIEGDLGLLLRMNELFSAGAASGGDEKVDNPAAAPRQPGPVRLSGTAWLTLAFLPWIVNWVAPVLSPGAWWGQAPLFLAAVLWGYRRLFGQSTLFEAGTLAYFLLTLGAALAGSGFFISYGAVLSSLALGLLWAGSLATPMPLTGHYSKWDWPQALWTNAVFTKTNAVITVFWVGIYLLQAVAALAGKYGPSGALAWTIVRYSLLIPGFAFTVWFQKWYPTYGSVKEKAG